MDKTEFRKGFLQIRDEIENKSELSDIITKKLLDMECYKSAKSIFVYLSFKSEVSTKRIIEDAWASGKQVFSPVMTDNGSMEAIRYFDMQGLVRNKFGIDEPNKFNDIATKGQIDLAVVPGCVFDREGNRIGYGKGYYDKYFEMRPQMVKVAIAYDKQIMDKIPTEKHDIKMDYIVTEKETIRKKQ